MDGMVDDGVGKGSAGDRLERLLEAARTAGPMDRIGFRDKLAAEGAAAIPAMAEWLLDPRLGALAVRVLSRIGRERVAEAGGASAGSGAAPAPAARSLAASAASAPAARSLAGSAAPAPGQAASARAAVIRALSEAEPEAPSAGIRSDILEALAELGAARSAGRGSRASRSSTPGSPRHEGPLIGLPRSPGAAGRRYWAMRTSDKYRDLIWAEAVQGRLRQGWGWDVEQDLRRIADRVAAGLDLTDAQRMAWRARRMLDTEPDGIGPGDLIVTQNLPRPGHLAVFRVTGAYSFALPDEVEDFGHIVPVELLEEDIGRHDVHVTDALRRAISLQPRLYEITPYGGDVDALVRRG